MAPDKLGDSNDPRGEGRWDGSSREGYPRSSEHDERLRSQEHQRQLDCTVLKEGGREEGGMKWGGGGGGGGRERGKERGKVRGTGTGERERER